MAAKKCKCKPPGAPVWMCTFADLMALLLCFFVLILSFASLDKPSFKQAALSLEKAFGRLKTEEAVVTQIGAPEMITREFPSVPISVEREIKEIFKDQIESGLIELVEEDGESITVRLKSSLAYESGRAEIRENFKPLLDKLGKAIVTMEGSVIVSGHTDNVPMRAGARFRSNWGLSTARAAAVVEYWLTKHEIPAKRLSVAGYAEGRPVATNNTVEGRASNRRVEFRIRPGKRGLAFDGIEKLVE